MSMRINLHQIINFTATLHRKNTFQSNLAISSYQIVIQTVTSRLRVRLDRDLTARWLKPKIETWLSCIDLNSVLVPLLFVYYLF